MNRNSKYGIARLLHRAHITYPVRNVLFGLLKRWTSFDEVKNYPSGLKLCVDLTDYIGFRIWERGVWERRVIALARTLLRNGGVFIDIGSHCGYFATSIAHEYPRTVRAIGFEPNQRVARLARRNVELNSLQNLVFDSRAVSNRS